MVNGTVYPYLNVEPKAYRFRILNACNDRFLNLQLYLDASGGGTGATATAIVDLPLDLFRRSGLRTAAPVIPASRGQHHRRRRFRRHGFRHDFRWGRLPAITITNPGSGYTSAPTVTIGATTEVSMVPASPNGAIPTWPKDGRDGGVPDPATAGPKFHPDRHRRRHPAGGGGAHQPAG